MSKTMSPDEFAEWATRHTPQEVQEKAIELQDALVTELSESAGVTREEYEHAGTDERLMIAERGGQSWMDESDRREFAEAASDVEAQQDIQSQFCEMHPKHFPSKLNGDLFFAEYVRQWEESNPGLSCFWEIDAMEALYKALVNANAFEVTRVKSE